ncbi:hypothetical protein FEA48_21085 [Pseudomonas nitroreducens]|uniref:Uncharacterized protein n=1 Tax=Pseudomonas nitroreducens TaxID=46680 RepID=A0A5R8ZY27_PSENT|nr:hypothetical protein [Pseudomonas nitroreducens]TLP71322.1 hypothetical protein FEA48_21085 [Pseudomonas nitroreducens]
MKKDWVVWGGCALLFFTGVVWGMASAPKEFFHVDSVHDAFDMAASIATVLGVIGAIVQLNSWRKQQAANNDHNLAVRIASELNGQENKIKRAWGTAAIAHHAIAANIRAGDESFKSGARAGLVKYVDTQAEDFVKASAEFKSVAFECDVYWGGSYISPVTELIELSDLCISYFQCFRSYVAAGGAAELASIDGGSLDKAWGAMEAKGLVRFSEVGVYVSTRVEEFVSILRRDFITSSK